MAKDIVCPVCGKHDIPDYHKEDVVCPCCGSDLSIYRVVDQIPENGKNLSWKISTATAFCAAAVLAVILVLNLGTSEPEHSEAEYAQLTDSISSLNHLLDEAQTASIVQSTTGFPYVVRSGDSFWKISQRFYGTGIHAAKIAEMNNLTKEDVLHKGDTLFIK